MGDIMGAWQEGKNHHLAVAALVNYQKHESNELAKMPVIFVSNLRTQDGGHPYKVTE